MSTEPTTCPTCGAAVRVAGKGLTHWYEPIEPDRAALKRLYRVLYDARADLRDAGDEVARLRRLLTELIHAGRALHEDILRHNGGGMWSDAHGAFVAALNAVGAEDLEAGGGNG